MKKIILLLVLFIPFISCKKEIPEPPTETTSNTHGWGNTNFNEYGVTFFTTIDRGYGPISVSFGGFTGTITYYYNYDPGCNAMGCANFTVPPGTYYFSAVDGPVYRNGEIKTGASQCITIRI